MSNPILLGKRFVQKGFEIISRFSKPKNKARMLFFISRLMPFYRPKPSEPTINFLVTSKAEVRVFSPIIRRIINSTGVKANVIMLSEVEFPPALQRDIRKVSNVTITDATYPIVLSSLNAENWVNVVCLDHNLHISHHEVGVKFIRLINTHGGKTVCLQHGSIRKDNIEGHKTSESENQIVWGAHIYQSLIKDSGIDESHIFLEGNPLHDELFGLNSEEILNRLDRHLNEIGKSIKERKIILLATCLHSEYENKKNPQNLYRQYIRNIYKSIDFENYFLVVKMHPMDSININIYEEQLNPEFKQDVVIVKPEDSFFSFYELVKIATLVITRASTVAEESLIIGKAVLAYDLFRDGPSSDLALLNTNPKFEICAGKSVDLAHQIKRMSNHWKSDQPINQKLMKDITYKFDGNSTKRVLNRLIAIAKK